VLGIYADLWDFGYRIARLTGWSGDEFKNFSNTLKDQEFFLNELRSDNLEIEELWKYLYRPIYSSNAALAGLESSSQINTDVKEQLEGEVRFFRAFCYFQLVNLFGDAPLMTSPDYKVNAVTPRSSIADINLFIVNDLTLANDLLSEDYPRSENVRVNKFSAQSLLSRVHLYMEDWEQAETIANSVIVNGGYALDTVTSVFLANSNEAILQFYPLTNFANTAEGLNFIPTSAPPRFVGLTDQLLNSFEPDDLRRQNWVGEITDPSVGTFYYPFKYKIQNSEIKTEYAVVLRLAEQYLIRAEARARQDNLEEAVADLNMIRERAGLPEANINDKTALLAAIEQERSVELFSEWGHRWFDLKRTGRAEAVLGPLKLGWQNTDALYPIPLREINLNYTLTQNPSY
jgi:hypothetical protein